jgi:hypothetical protein
MWKSRNKTDLIIEVWEKLDCESVGAAEIEAIETVVAAEFGKPAVDSPMITARLLADEGAELRHSEVMELYIRRASDRPYDAVFLNILDTSNLRTTLNSIRNMENLRRKLETGNDREGLRLLREKAIAEKDSKPVVAAKRNTDLNKMLEAREIAEWLTLWLQSPEMFENWLTLRRRSSDFVSKFGEI